MSNYKKVVLLSLVFSCIIFFVGNLLKKESHSIPNPEGHIREVIGLLKANDLKGFKKLVFPIEEMKKMKKEEGILFFSAFPNMDESMAKMAWELLQEMDDEYLKQYENAFEVQFKDIREELEIKENFEIERIQWKMTGNSNVQHQFHCNAKIYIKSNKKYFCIRYKNILFYKGKWYAGGLVDVDEIDEPANNAVPDMFKQYLIDEYINSLEEAGAETPEEAVESEIEKEDVPKTEED